MNSASRPGPVANALAIAGFVVVVIIIIWGLIHLSTLASPWLSSLFSPAGTSQTPLEVQAPGSAVSGQPFTLTWSSPASAQGTYGLIYPCSAALSFRAVSASSTQANIPCGAAFTVSGNSVSLVPLLAGTTTINEPLSIIFTPAFGSGGASAQGSATIAIKPGANPIAPASVATASAPAQVVSSGRPDLAVRIISATGDGSGNATLVFEIANNGSGASDRYSFTVYLPTVSRSYTYYSPDQSPLSPGSHIVNTLHFTQAVSGTISIVVNASRDVDQTNNYASAALSMPYSPQPPYQQYYPQYYPQPYPYVSY